MKPKKTFFSSKRARLFVLLFFVFLCLDLWSKNFFYNTISGVLNQGAIRGLHIPSWISVVFWLIVLFPLLFYRQKQRLPSVFTSIFLAGIMGNMYDRLLFHGVRDWISFQYFFDFQKIFWFQFPFFNVADLYLFVSIVFLALRVLLPRKAKW